MRGSEALLARIVGEVKTSRVLLDARKSQVVALENELAIEKANSASLDKSYKAAEREISFLRDSVTHLEEAIASKEQVIALLTTQRDEARRSAKKANKRAAISTAASIALLLMRFL
jgi:septal ring factor EnvC (AmiA/AmiB activator)